MPGTEMISDGVVHPSDVSGKDVDVMTSGEEPDFP